ncbi:MAG: hypothetical protein U0516_03715 [Candidatus Saccharibacteria bacterium]
MATKKSTAKPKSRTSNKNSSRLTQFKFRWWMAIVLIAVVAVIGVIIVRFSFADGGGGNCIFYSGHCQYHTDDISRYQVPGSLKGYGCAPYKYVYSDPPYKCARYEQN